MHSAARLRQLLAVLLLFVSSSACPLEGASMVDVIVSPALASTKLDRSLLRAVFTMRVRQWPDGLPVRVFVLPDDDPLSDQFYRERLGMYSYVLRRAWDRMVFTGTGFAPTIVRTEREMIERVRSTPGAIGYVGKRELSESDARLLRSTGMLLTKGTHD
jgi:ABC-type phosphate transport system substrate-binding protein